jgi:HK97 family phage portal protein
MTAVGFDPEKLQLNQARQYLATEISRLVGIPAWYLSADVNSMTYSNVVSERRSLVDFSLRPLLKSVEQRLSMPDFTPNTQEVVFDMDDFLRGNPLERAQTLEILVRSGIMTIEEAREEEDLIK